jgi:hypothetical protein
MLRNPRLIATDRYPNHIVRALHLSAIFLQRRLRNMDSRLGRLPRSVRSARRLLGSTDDTPISSGPAWTTGPENRRYSVAMGVREDIRAALLSVCHRMLPLWSIPSTPCMFSGEGSKQGRDEEGGDANGEEVRLVGVA